MTEQRMLVELLEQAHRGAPWHGSSRSALLQGVGPAAASARPPGGGHSIWELVLHMTAWTREVARRVRGSAAGEPGMGDWPHVGETSEDAWRAARAALDSAHDELLVAVRELKPDRLSEPVVDERPGESGGHSVRDTIVGVLQHDAYHCGQIGVLRKQLSAAAASSASGHSP